MSLNFEEVAEMVAELSVLDYFPQEPAARLAIVRLIGDMAVDISQVQWLIRRMTNGKLYAKWPGPHEMRACFCSKFPPRDGINVHSSIYVDGIPSERTAPKQLAGPELKALPPGHTVTTDPELDTLIVQAAAAKAIPTRPLPHTTRSAKFTRDLAELLTAPQDRDPLPGPTPQIITQADIDRAVAQHRAEKASAQQTLDF